MSNQISWTLRKQMLEDRIKHVANLLDISEDQAFMRVSYALILNASYDDANYSMDVVDGGDDKQIDIVRIDESSDNAIIHFIQVKNSSKYKGTTVVQMRDGLEWALRSPEHKYEQITNNDLVLKINAIRELSGRLGMRRLDICVHYVAKGDTSNLSPDFRKEIQHTLDMYLESGEFLNFSFKVWGVNELIEKYYENEEESARIDASIPIYFTPYAPSYSQYRAGAIKAAICTIDGLELANLVNKHYPKIFEQNVRTYLGDRKRVNAAILKTCSDENLADHFWFFNNGITVTCSDFDVTYNADPAFIKIYNMQIVNGCQTSMTLAEAQKRGILNTKTKVMLKVYASQEPSFIEKITIATNNQNAVSSRDLRSNDILQRDLQKLFDVRGYYYERKAREFSKLSKPEQKKIIPNEKVGQAYLAVVQHLPAVAMSQPSKIWDDYYDDIFKSRVEELLGSYLIYRYCVQVRDSRVSQDLSGYEEAVLKYGTFHLSRIMGHLEMDGNWRVASESDLTSLVKTIEDSPNKLDNNYDQAKEMLYEIVREIAGNDYTSLINIFKSADIQKKIDVALT